MDIDMPESMQLKMDVTRSDEGYVVKVEMPGVKKEDIHVTVDGSQVTISGEVKRESEEKQDEQVIRSERYYGKVARSFTLPQDIDEAKVAAQYNDGVLELKLPRKAKSAGRKIEVK
jgi:HSP20 family protein